MVSCAALAASLLLAAPAAALAPGAAFARASEPLFRARLCTMAANSDSEARRAERRARRKAKRSMSQSSADTPTGAAATTPPPPEVMSLPSPSPTPYSPVEFESSAPLVEDTPAVPLPSFDDFRRRDADAAAARGVTPISAAATGGTAPSAPYRGETAAERLMELLSFDTIDERPPNEDPYDATARLIGRGLPNKAGAYLLPYLQSGHMLLLGVLLLSSSISYPGFPLTEVPDEYRDLIHQGLIITYMVNAVCAVFARGIATKKQQPINFWFAKVFLFGGLALGELTQAVPDAPPPQKRPGRL